MKIRIKYHLSFDIYKLYLAITAIMVKILFETIDDTPYLSVYLFNTKVYRKRYIVKRKKTSPMSLLRIVDSTNEGAKLNYGFSNPAATGLLYAALSTLPDVYQCPDFLPEYDYIIVDGSTIIYLWSTIMNYIKYKKKG